MPPKFNEKTRLFTCACLFAWMWVCRILLLSISKKMKISTQNNHEHKTHRISLGKKSPDEKGKMRPIRDYRSIDNVN